MLGSHRHPPILGGCPYSSERKAILHIRLSMAVVFAIAVNAEEANGSGSAVRRCGLCTVEMLSLQCGDAVSKGCGGGGRFSKPMTPMTMTAMTVGVFIFWEFEKVTKVKG